jgi:serine/threonine-protein kinase
LLFYAMPYVEGESLRDRLDRQKLLPVNEAVRIGCEVGEALAYAHAHGVIHRDIKPGNILLQSGHAVVADFGIARAVTAAGAQRVTVLGMVLGTAAYMSPEQSAGEDVDQRTDQYALASVLYEMLTGEPPFTGPTVESILGKRFTQPAPRVTLKRPSVPRSIEVALCTALASNRDDRYARVEDFTEALTTMTPTSDDGATHRSIAVIPFVNMSGDPENDYFSDGMSEEISNALTQLPGLRVAARTSAYFFKGKETDLKAIGDQLNVSTVLQGSVRKAGNRLRIIAQLIDVAGGYHLWSERYDRELTDVFAIQDEIVKAIVTKLRLTLGARLDETLIRPSTANLEAYDLYLKGRALTQQRGPALLAAVECFERAVALDPGFAPAQAELAEALLLVSVYGVRPMGDVRQRAVEATTHALDRDPSSVAAHVALALVAFLVDHDRERAARAWARAVELEPAKGEARVSRAMFDFCYVRGAYQDAVEELREVLELDPLNVHARGTLGIVLTWAERFDEAAAEAQRGIDIDPNAFLPQWALLLALALGPRPTEGVRVGNQLLTRFGRHPWLLWGLSLASGAAGSIEVAEALYAELQARSRSEYVQPAALAAAALGAGRREDLFRHLREAVDRSDPLLAICAGHWPGFAPLRGDPEFESILTRFGWGEPFDASASEV